MKDNNYFTYAVETYEEKLNGWCTFGVPQKTKALALKYWNKNFEDTSTLGQNGSEYWNAKELKTKKIRLAVIEHVVNTSYEEIENA